MPQIIGVAMPDVPVAWKESVHAPPSVSTVVAGPSIVNDSKSRRTEQTSEEHLLIVYVKAVCEE